MASQTSFDGFPDDEKTKPASPSSLEMQKAHTERQLRRAEQVVKQLRFALSNHQAGLTGERALAEEVKQFLAQWVDAPWHFLFDRKWPRTRNANIDLIVVGPPGIFVVDVKNWTGAKAEYGKLFANGFDCTATLKGIRDQAKAINRILTPIGIPAGRVMAMMILAQSVAPSKKVAGVLVAGMPHLASTLLRLPSQYKRKEIDEIAALLNEALVSCAPVQSDEYKLEDWPSEVQAISPEDFLAAAGSHRQRLDWMVRMHPSQADFTAKVFQGPARLSGSAGTGKTVAALHRAFAKSQEPGASVLLLGPTKILSQQHEAMLQRLGGGQSDVTCSTLASWCFEYLRSKRIRPAVTDGTAQLRQSIHASKNAKLVSATGCSAEYLVEEISHVIKARGITDWRDYLDLERRGRRCPMRETQREAVWALYQTYEELLRNAGKIDWRDLTSMTLRQIELDEHSSQYVPPFTSVIVDEAQDFTLNEMRLIRRLARESEDGLLLLGDSGQQIFPGGFRLSEAGIAIAGSRSLSFSLNFRNGSNIKRRADEVLSNNSVLSLADEESFGHQPGDSVCAPGSVTEETFRGTADQERALVKFLRSRRPDGWGTMAVLTERWEDLGKWKKIVKQAGIPCALLSDVDPRVDSDYVVIGTFTKAKGLEFASVAIPTAAPRPASGPEEAERHLLESQRLYVGISRAVCSLWIGKLKQPSTLEKRSA